MGGVLVVLVDPDLMGREPSGRLRSDEPAALASELIDGVLDRHPAVTLGRLRLAESSEFDLPSELRVLSTDGRPLDSRDGRSVVASRDGGSLLCATKAAFRARREERRTGTWASCGLSRTGTLSCVCAARACLAANAAPTPAMPATPPTPVAPVVLISLDGCISGSARNSALSWPWLGTGGGAGIVGEKTDAGETADRAPWLEPAELIDALRCNALGTSGMGGEVDVDGGFGELPGWGKLLLLAFRRENGLCLTVPFSFPELSGPPIRGDPLRREPSMRAADARGGGMLLRDDERDGSAPSGRTSAVWGVSRRGGGGGCGRWTSVKGSGRAATGAGSAAVSGSLAGDGTCGASVACGCGVGVF